MKESTPQRQPEDPQVVGPLETGQASEWRQIPLRPRATQQADAPAKPEQRVDTSTERSLAVRFTTIDPVRDPVTGALFYDTSDEEVVLNVSRRGICLRCERPPAVGTRVLLQITLPAEAQPVDIIGRACWTRVEYTPGEHGARAIAVVGIELLSGSAAALDTYDRSLGRLLQRSETSVATPEVLG